MQSELWPSIGRTAHASLPPAPIPAVSHGTQGYAAGVCWVPCREGKNHRTLRRDNRTFRVKHHPYERSFSRIGPPKRCTAGEHHLYQLWVCVKIEPPGTGPHVLDHDSIYQGKPCWVPPIFDPQPAEGGFPSSGWLLGCIFKDFCLILVLWHPLAPAGNGQPELAAV